MGLFPNIKPSLQIFISFSDGRLTDGIHVLWSQILSSREWRERVNRVVKD